jgi:UDP-N-acetyl-D-mannosaminuronic acid dehydrogenase
LGQAGIGIEGASVLVMGYAYLEDSDDTRNSPSKTLVDRLRELGAEVKVHDPYVPELNGPLEEASRGCQAVVVMVKHQEYVNLDLARLKEWMTGLVLVDTRHVYSTEAIERAGFVYRMVGVGAK